MTCKNCLHFNMCYVLADNPAEAEVEGAETDCSYFKDRSKYVVREKGEWILNRNGSATCKKCLHTTLDAWGVDKWLNFCPNCGADMRKGENDG